MVPENRRCKISTGAAEKPRLSVWMAVIAAVAAVGPFAALSGCQPSAQQTSHVPEQEPPVAVTASQEEIALEPGEPVRGQTQRTEGSVAKIITRKGDIIIELFDKGAPITAGNFLLLAESGFYDGLVFHRVEPGFVVQGGDPTGTGAGGPGFTIPDEVSPELKHDRGMLSMAKTALPDTGGSQFFICLGGPDALCHLDMKHAVFGKVVKGMDVVDQIRRGDRMQEVKVEHESPHAEAAKAAAKKARVYQ